jgi:hypothetical protein
MAFHLWTGGPPPPEYVEMNIMREFGWTYAELNDTPQHVVLDILTMISAENEFRNRHG